MKKRKNKVVVQLSASQRLVMWSSLDLLSCLDPNEYPKIDELSYQNLLGLFDCLDGDSRDLGIEFNSREHRICAIALKYARKYVDGEFKHFKMPIIPKIDQELCEFASIVRELDFLFNGS